MISNHSQSQSKLQLDKETGLLGPTSFPSYDTSDLHATSDLAVGRIYILFC